MSLTILFDEAKEKENKPKTQSEGVKLCPFCFKMWKTGHNCKEMSTFRNRIRYRRFY